MAFTTQILDAYARFLAILPTWAQAFVNLFLIAGFIFIYLIFVWKSYKVFSKKDFFNLNLDKYNNVEHAFMTKLLAGALYFLEYLIISPILIFLGFGLFTILLILLTEGIATQQILIISAVILTVIRMSAYYNEELSKELSKILPFTILAIFILSTKSLNINQVINHFSGIPNFFGEVMIYLAFIILLEIILRIIDLITSLFEIGEDAHKFKQD